MKKKTFLLTAFLGLLLSCGGPEKDIDTIIEDGDITEIREKKAELGAIQNDLSAKIARLDAAIRKLDPEHDLPLVKTLEVQDTLFEHFFQLPGDVETDENITIYPEYSGVLVDVSVEEGQRVRKGSVLARIDDGGLKNQLAQIKTRAALAKTTFERQKRLWEQNIGSEIQFLEAKTNYEAVQSSVEQMEAQLGKTVVRAPFSGIIDEILTDQGQVVVPGQTPLFRLINLSDMYITAAVPENHLGSISEGTEVAVEIQATGTAFESQISQIGNFIDPDNRTFEIKIPVPDGQKEVKPNLIANIRVKDYSAPAAIIIPDNSIQRNAAGENVVYLLEKKTDSTGIAQKQKIITGLSYDGRTEVVEGLEPGDMLITDGTRNLREGESVQIEL